MTTNLKENTSFVLNVLKLLSIVVACVAAIAFFIYETKGLPPRVSKLESEIEQTNKEINELKTEISKNSAKTDIILDDVKIVKTYLLNGNR